MKMRKLGNSDLDVSEIGLGCWQLGGDFGPIEDERARAVLTTALEQKINFFDTADVYGGGRSESYIGETLPKQDDIFVATKYGRAAGTYPDGYSLDDMRDSIRRAQDRLQRNIIDLIQLHCVPPSVLKQGAIFDWLRTVQQDGLIRYFGASVETMDEALLCTQQEGLTSLQIIFNIFRQDPIKKLFDITKDKGIGIIVRLPLASGLLSGRYNEKTQFSSSDHRNYNKDGQAFSVGETFSGIPFKKGLELLEKINQHRPDAYTSTQFALRWILDHDAVTTVIAGTTRPEQVKENVSASDVSPLSDEAHKALYDFYLSEVESNIRGVY